ncbi:MAG TPA: hypothetical protein EYP14_19810, partial [Planctomycetaceae bacterium]|nr:hypothetical protein [Planctomycetaceae bacterium]
MSQKGGASGGRLEITGCFSGEGTGKGGLCHRLQHGGEDGRTIMDASLFGIGPAGGGWTRGLDDAAAFLLGWAHWPVPIASGATGVPWWPLGLIAMVVLLVASALFSSSETALFSLTHEELRQFRIGRRGERKAVRLLSNP